MRIHSVLVSIEFCKSVSTLSEDMILELVDQGELEYAFDIKAAGRHRRSVRVLVDSLRSYIDRSEKPSLKLDEAIALIVPRGLGDKIKASVVARRFNCSPTHVYDLVKTGSIRMLQKGRVEKDSALLCRQSVVQFLKSRRMC